MAQMMNSIFQNSTYTQSSDKTAILEADKKLSQRLCDRENAREGRLHLKDGYSCSLCKNKGYTLRSVFYNGRYQEEQVTCRCDPIRTSLRELKRIGLERVVDSYTLEKYIVNTPWRETIKKTAEHYLTDDNAMWLYFGGNSGCGKSHICTAIAVQLLYRGNKLYYMRWREDSTELKQTLTDGSAYQQKISAIKEADILYIDDLFKTGRSTGQQKQMPTAADINLAFDILNARYVSRKRTIISSECSVVDLLTIDEAIGGRVKELCGHYILQADGKEKDFRINPRGMV